MSEDMGVTWDRTSSQLLGKEIQNNGLKPEMVCGPAIGGVICAQYTALALGSRCVFSERVVN